MNERPERRLARPSLESAALENRIKKNPKRLKAWANRENVGCFRVYDRDISAVPLAIDLYTALDGVRRAHIAVFEPRHGVSSAQVEESAWAEDNPRENGF